VSALWPIADRPQFIAGIDAMIGDSREHAYPIGDQLLRETGEQLRALSKTPENVFRISSKTFALLMPRIANAAFVALAVNRVQVTLREALFIDDDLLPVDLRFGLPLNHDAREPALSTLRRRRCISRARAWPSRRMSPVRFWRRRWRRAHG